uniref:Uncharacterized protein n=1 Tax=Siphoviridae sp. ct4Z13 TaxID=2827778 RepID=A0A8S5SBK3_9CAUD|nr:MAG TPA: hypothetical protein [Siphoviridae sp. ct4Z13]DAY94557.1 MAG TPA: hypothetical protein [Caudoviricetes sp.]
MISFTKVKTTEQLFLRLLTCRGISLLSPQ